MIFFPISSPKDQNIGQKLLFLAKLTLPKQPFFSLDKIDLSFDYIEAFLNVLIFSFLTIFFGTDLLHFWNRFTTFLEQIYYIFGTDLLLPHMGLEQIYYIFSASLSELGNQGLYHVLFGAFDRRLIVHDVQVDLQDLVPYL